MKSSFKNFLKPLWKIHYNTIIIINNNNYSNNNNSDDNKWHIRPSTPRMSLHHCSCVKGHVLKGMCQHMDSPWDALGEI